MSILYVGCRKFSTNRFVGNFCLYIYIYRVALSYKKLGDRLGPQLNKAPN
jgi:hypothetical protein